ncbi:hypothetical protein Tco_1051199 [Tanacetum coccineum]
MACKRKEKEEDGPEWVVRNKFEDELANFMLEKKLHMKGIGDMLDQHLSTRYPPFPTPSQSTPANQAEGETKKGPGGAESSIIQDEEAPRSSFFYQPSKSSNMSFPSRVRKQKRDDEDERLLSIFKQIHINLPFLEAIIHMPKGSKVLKDFLSHKEKLEKAASSVKLSEECSATSKEAYPKKKETRVVSRYHVLSDHWQKLTKAEDEGDSNKVQAVSFYPRTEPIEPLEWKALKNRLKPSSELELKELPKHLEYAFLQENNKLPVVISSALSAIEKARILEVLKDHKGVIAWCIADIQGIDSSFSTYKILMEDEFNPSVQP